MTSSFTRHVSTFLNNGLDVHYNNITGSTLYAGQQEAQQLPVAEEKSCIVLKAMWVGYIMPGYQDTFRIGSIDYNLVETMIIPDILRVYEPKTQAAWLDLVKHYARMNKVDVIYTDNGNAFTGISRTQTGANPIPVYRVGEFRTWQPIGYLDIEGCIDSASIAHTIKPTVSKSAPPAGLENINSALYEKFSKLNAELNNMLQDMIKTDEFTSEQSEKLLKAAADLNKTVKIRDEIDKLASHL
jgi:hypothetical protein